MRYVDKVVSNSLVITVDPWLVDVSGCTVVVAPDVVATVLSDVPLYKKPQQNMYTISTSFFVFLLLCLRLLHFTNDIESAEAQVRYLRSTCHSRLNDCF